jgi:hypothetical protein
VSQIRFCVVCGRSCFNDLTVFVFIRGVVGFRFLRALCCVGGYVFLILICNYRKSGIGCGVVLVIEICVWCRFNMVITYNSFCFDVC